MESRVSHKRSVGGWTEHNSVRFSIIIKASEHNMSGECSKYWKIVGSQMCGAMLKCNAELQCWGAMLSRNAGPSVNVPKIKVALTKMALNIFT